MLVNTILYVLTLFRFYWMFVDTRCHPPIDTPSLTLTRWHPLLTLVIEAIRYLLCVNTILCLLTLVDTIVALFNVYWHSLVIFIVYWHYFYVIWWVLTLFLLFSLILTLFWHSIPLSYTFLHNQGPYKSIK